MSIRFNALNRRCTQADRAIRRDAASARSGIDPRQMMARAKSAKASGSKATGPEFGISGDGSDDEGVAASAAGQPMVRIM